MSDSTPTTVQESPRRRGKDTKESSGGGAKILVIVLLIIAGLLGFMLYKNNGSARTQSEADAKTMTTLSNQVAELRTKLALEHSNGEVAQSNHQALVTRRTAEVNVLSNRLVQTTLLLERAREETRLAQAQLPAKAAALAALEVRQEELQREVALLPPLRREAASLKEKLQQAQFSQSALQEAVGRLSAEKADLERKLEDPAFLQLQAKRAQEAADVRQRAAANKRIYPADPRVRLDLQPDGSVRPAITADAASASGR